MEKMNKKLIEEMNTMKKWMNFLNDSSNYNKSFHKSGNSRLIRETNYDDPNDTFGSPEEESDKLILGNDEQNENTINDENFIVISTDINGGIYVKLVEAEDENSALEQTENEMIIQNMVISEDSLMELITKLTQYLPEELTSVDEPDKPPFIDEPDEEVIDEDMI